jgi:type II secretory pathway pseudopilin PulG
MTWRHSRGFTIIELISIMIIIGILAVTAMPSLKSAMSFRDVEFRDRVIAALRYAQKTSTSHRRLVCATLTQTSVTLTLDSSNPKTGTCDAALPIPGVATPQLSAHQNGFANAVAPSVLFFQPDGRMTSDSAGATITDFSNTIDGNAVVVRGATGYVGDGS